MSPLDLINRTDFKWTVFSINNEVVVLSNKVKWGSRSLLQKQLEGSSVQEWKGAGDYSPVLSNKMEQEGHQFKNQPESKGDTCTRLINSDSSSTKILEH